MDFREFSNTLHNIIEYKAYRALVSFTYYETDYENNDFDKMIHFGTGFLFVRFDKSEMPHFFIITAKHVVDDALEYKKTKIVSCKFPIQEHKSPNDSVCYANIPFDRIQFTSFEAYDLAFSEITINFYEILKLKIDRIDLQTLEYNPYKTGNDPHFIFGLPSNKNFYKNKRDMKNYRFDWSMLITVPISDLSVDLINKTEIENPIFLQFNRKEITNIKSITEDNKSIPDGNFVKTEGMSGSPYCIGSSVAGVLIEVYPSREVSPFPKALIVSDLNNILDKIDNHILSNHLFLLKVESPPCPNVPT